MTTIASHLVIASVPTVHHLRYLRLAATAKPASQATGGAAVVGLVVIGTLLAVVASAARSLAAVIAQFVRLAAAMTSAVALMMVAVLATAVLLIHH